VTPEEQQAAAARDQLEEKLVPVMVTALAARPESEQAATPAAVERGIATAYGVALIAAMSALVSLLSRGRPDVDSAVAGKLMRDQQAQRDMDAVTRRRSIELGSLAVDWSAAHLDRLRETGRPVQPPDRPWAEQAARSLATHAASVAAEDAASIVAPALARVAELEGTPEFRKVWITRGDKRVRPLHRRLHGLPAKMDESFWRWPVTGQQLRFPGDPAAPLGETVNCRCTLFYVPVEVDPADVITALGPADYENSFDLVASAAVRSSDGLRRRALEDLIKERDG